MKFLCFEIKYIGFGVSKKLSSKNTKLIRKALDAGMKDPYQNGSPNRILVVTFVRDYTGASLKDAHDFVRKYIY